MKGLRRKVWTGTKNWSPKLRYFVTIIWLVTNHALFGNLWRKKCFLGSNTVFFGQEVHYYMVYIAYFTELNSKIWDYAQKQHICRENCKYALDERFHGHFCPRRKPAKSCHPDLHWNVLISVVLFFSLSLSSSSLYSMVGFRRWQIPTIIITVKTPPWWDFDWWEYAG